MPVFRD